MSNDKYWTKYTGKEKSKSIFFPKFFSKFYGRGILNMNNMCNVTWSTKGEKMFLFQLKVGHALDSLDKKTYIIQSLGWQNGDLNGKLHAVLIHSRIN